MMLVMLMAYEFIISHSPVPPLQNEYFIVGGYRWWSAWDIPSCVSPSKGLNKRSNVLVSKT